MLMKRLGLGESVGFREHVELDTRYLEIHAPGDRGAYWSGVYDHFTWKTLSPQ